MSKPQLQAGHRLEYVPFHCAQFNAFEAQVLIGIVSDAHGNSLGLSQTLEFLAMQGVQKILFLGDAVGYMPDWKGVFSLLEEYRVECVRGNHEQMSFGQAIDEKRNDVYRILPHLIQENSLHLSRAKQWPLSLTMKVDGRELLFVHASPWQHSEGYAYFYPDSPLDRFGSLSADAIFMGHTHYPFVREVSDKLVVNVGSCGLPRDVGDLGSCAIYDSERHECSIFRIPFDAAMVLRSFQGQLHESVAACLLRRADNHFGVLHCPVPKHDG